MRKLFVAALVIGCFCGSVYPQAESKVSSKIVKVDDGKPTVYLAVDRNDKERLWLRLKNNTAWAIAVRTYSFYFNRKQATSLAIGSSVFILPSDQNIDSLHYYVEKELRTRSRTNPPDLGYPDSFSISWIPAQGSILFAVPVKHLAPGLMVYVPFQYEWELNTQMIFNKEPEHRVYVRGVDLSQHAAVVRQ